MAGRSRAVPVTLTIKRRRKLEQIIAAGTSPQRLVLRAEIVLAAAAGTANAAIARDLGCSAAVVRTWRGRFAVRGLPGLVDAMKERSLPLPWRMLEVAKYPSPPGIREAPQWRQRMTAGRLSAWICTAAGRCWCG
jgi:hypothetical protein